MEMTVHGLVRLNERTKMREEDIVTLIVANVVISLGFYEMYEYLLFYSPNDRSCKIAIVSEDRSTLITVYGAEYRIPKNLKRPTRQLLEQAKFIFTDFLFKRIKENNIPYDLKQTEVQLLPPDTGRSKTLRLNASRKVVPKKVKKFAHIQVLSGSGKVYTILYEHKKIVVPQHISNSRDSIVCVKVYLEKIFCVLCEVCSDFKDIFVRIQFFEDNKKPIQEGGYFFDVETLKILLVTI